MAFIICNQGNNGNIAEHAKDPHIDSIISLTCWLHHVSPMVINPMDGHMLDSGHGRVETAKYW